MSDQDITPEHPLLPHRDFLRRLARALASDETRAADLQQDVWLAALRRPGREIAHLRSVRGWARRVAQRLVSNASRGERRRAARERHVARGEAAVSVGEVAADLDLQRKVVEAVRALPEPQRTAIHLRYYKDRSPTAIARALDVSVRTVESRLRRGRELLREALDRECGSRSSWSTALVAAHGLAGSETASAAAVTTAGPTWAAACALFALALGCWVVASLAFRGEVELASRSTPAHLVAQPTVAPVATDLLTAIGDERRATRSPLTEVVGTEPRDTRQTRSAISITGRVTTTLDKGEVPAVLIFDPERRYLGATQCDASGRYSIEVEAATHFIVVAVAPGQEPKTTEVEIVPGARERRLEFALDEGSVIRGSVSFEGEHLRPGTELWVRRQHLDKEFELRWIKLGWVGGRAVHWRCDGTVAEAGRFLLTGLTPGTYELAARLGGGRAATWVSRGVEPLVVEAPSVNLSLELRGDRYFLEVRASGRPLDCVYAEIGTCSSGSDGVDGEFLWKSGLSVTERGVVIILDARMDHWLAVEREGYASALLRLADAVVDKNGTLVVEMEPLRAPSTAVLRVLDASGAAPEAIHVRGSRDGLGSHRRRLWIGRLVQRGGSGFLLEDVPPGEWTLTISVARLGTAPAFDVPAELIVDVPVSAQIERTVELARGGWVELRIPELQESIRPRCHAEDMHGLPVPVHLSPPGEWLPGSVKVFSEPLITGDYTLTLVAEGFDDWHGPIDVRAGEATTVIIDLVPR